MCIFFFMWSSTLLIFLLVHFCVCFMSSNLISKTSRTSVGHCRSVKQRCSGFHVVGQKDKYWTTATGLTEWRCCELALTTFKTTTTSTTTVEYRNTIKREQAWEFPSLCLMLMSNSKSQSTPLYLVQSSPVAVIKRYLRSKNDIWAYSATNFPFKQSILNKMFLQCSVLLWL